MTTTTVTDAELRRARWLQMIADARRQLEEAQLQLVRIAVEIQAADDEPDLMQLEHRLPSDDQEARR